MIVALRTTGSAKFCNHTMRVNDTQLQTEFRYYKITNIDIDITKLFQLNLLTWKYLFFAYKLEIITHK